MGRHAKPARVGADWQAVAIIATREVAGHDRPAPVSDDWFDFLAALLASQARFLVIGAHALAAHGVPRATQDIDIWVDPTPENSARVWAALEAFGAPAQALGITLEDLSTVNTVIQFGVPPNRIDILTGISGVATFDEAWRDRIEQQIRNRAIPVLGRVAFIANKRASGRHKDLADIEALGEKA